MRIFIDARTVRPGRTGVGYYTESMISALSRELSADDRLTLMTLYPQELPELPRRVRTSVTRIDYENHPLSELHENLVLPRRLRHAAIDVFWGPAFLIPWVRTSAQRIVTIHDLTAFTHPACYPPRFAWYMRQVIRRALLAADVVVCVSHFVASQIRQRFPRYPTIEVVPAAADPFFFPDPQWPKSTGRPFLLAIGAGDPRKDTRFLLRVHARIREMAGAVKPDLVLVGDWKGERLGEGVRLLPRQSRQELRELYQTASLFLFPTASEGFGLPILEAMQAGCPVAASRAGAVPEVAGNAAFLFDHRDEDTTARALFDLLNSTDQLAWYRAAGLERATQFSWEKSARRLMDVFARVVLQRSAGA